MTYLIAVIAGIVGAVLGYAVSATIAVAIAGWLGMSDFEGGRGMFGAFVVGPIGGLLSMATAIWITLRVRLGRVPLLAILVRIGGVVAAIVLLVVAGIEFRLYTIDTYTNTLPPTLEFEIRAPLSMVVPDRSVLRIELDTDKNVGEGQLFEDWSPCGDGHRATKGSVPLAFKTSSRLLVVRFPDGTTRLFRLSLSRDPRSTPTLGQWQHATFIDVSHESRPRPAPPDDPVEIRYRVRRAGED